MNRTRNMVNDEIRLKNRQDATERFKLLFPGDHIYDEYIEFYSFPYLWGSTSGPKGGVGCSAVTQFQMEVFSYRYKSCIYCGEDFIKIIDDFALTTRGNFDATK